MTRAMKMWRPAAALLALLVLAAVAAGADEPDPGGRAGLGRIFRQGCAEDRDLEIQTQCFCLARELTGMLSEGELRQFLDLAMQRGLIPRRRLGAGEVTPLVHGDARLEAAFATCTG
jgi:hypothetical protein